MSEDKEILLRFARMYQKAGDKRREPVVVEHQTEFESGTRGTGTAFECHPRFERLLIAAPRMLEVLKKCQEYLDCKREYLSHDGHLLANAVADVVREAENS